RGAPAGAGARPSPGRRRRRPRPRPSSSSIRQPDRGRRDTGEQLVETDNLSKTYGAIAAVDRVSLSVWRGEVYGFLGPNGAGKTTTLRMLAGLVRPTAGSAGVLGEQPGSPQALARTGVLIEATR